MAEILIDRCTFRVVRRQGWSWGRAPERFIDYALQRLPDLLAAKLEGLFPEDADSVYEAPLRISIKLPPAALEEDFFSSSPKSSASVSFESASFDEPLQSTLCAALRMPLALPAEPVPLSSQKQLRFTATPPDSQSHSFEYEPLRGFLLELVKKKELRRFLDSFVLHELEVWHAAIYPLQQQSSDAQDEKVALIFADFETVFSPPLALPITDRARLLRVRLILAAETAAKRRLNVRDPLLWIALDRFLPLAHSIYISPGELLPSNNEPNAPTSKVSANIIDSPSSVLANSGDTGPSNIHTSACYDLTEWSARVHSVLPFLVLGPLYRAGYFSALRAVLEAAHLSDNAHLFATALAYKVLEAPERGWRRFPLTQHAAAVFAGLPSAVSDEALHEFSRLIAPHVGPLNRWLTDSVNSGRDKESPVLLRRAESEHLSGFLLFDPPGCFLLAWVDDPPAAISLLQNLGSPTVLVSSEASGPRVLQELHRGRLTFITPVPPVRGETWSPVMQGPSRMGWTNHPDPSAEFLLRAARALEVSSQEADSLWEQFAIARSAIPRAKLQAFERSVTQGATVALGVLSWQLWKDRGRTTPQLALERLGDLDGFVRFSGETIQVGLPRGRRHSELFGAGLLAPVRDIPWFRGRRLEFGLG